MAGALQRDYLKRYPTVESVAQDIQSDQPYAALKMFEERGALEYFSGAFDLRGCDLSYFHKERKQGIKTRLLGMIGLKRK